MEYFEELKKYLKKLQEERDYFYKQVSFYDKRVADYLHIIELNNLSASDSSRVMKKLKEALKERRLSKASAASLCSLEAGIDHKIRDAKKIIKAHTSFPEKWRKECKSTDTYKELFDAR